MFYEDYCEAIKAIVLLLEIQPRSESGPNPDQRRLRDGESGYPLKTVRDQ